jgi:hypothetical protein
LLSQYVKIVKIKVPTFGGSSLATRRHASEIAREQEAVNENNLANEYMKYQKTWEEVMGRVVCSFA